MRPKLTSLCHIGMDNEIKIKRIRQALRLVRATGGRGTAHEADLLARLRKLCAN